MRTVQEPTSDPAGLRRLREGVDHIVVLMLENRSFDHMLGYLALEGHPVEGVRPGRANEHEGRSYPVHRLVGTGFSAGDPPHDGRASRIQARDPGRYVATYAERYPNERGEWGTVMGHYGAEQLPVYDHLAREFCVCDRWFATVAGATWPNRVAAVGGRTWGRIDTNRYALWYLLGWLNRSFLRELDARGVSWRWYSSDPATIRAIDRRYRWNTDLGHFAYVDQQSEYQTRNFLDDVAAGQLPSVAWIDPNVFLNVHPAIGDPPMSNDDHPPWDVTLAQRFVHKLYEALRRSSAWTRTLLVVVYDEHGGIYDHVVAPAPWGPRVPALVVSPYAGRGVVCNRPLNHASLTKTILLRFADEAAIRAMPRHVREAGDLSVALTEDLPRDAPPVARPGAAALTEEDLRPTFVDKISTIEVGVVLAERPEGWTDFQRDVAWLALQLRTILPPRLAIRVRWLLDRLVPRSVVEAGTAIGAAVMRNPRVQRLPVLRRLPPGMP